jgi:hypothetical protein
VLGSAGRRAATLALLVLSARAAEATLSFGLHDLIVQNSQTAGRVADTLTPLIQRIALRATSLPATSTVPAVTYEFDFESGALKRTDGPIGSLFVDRPETVGRGRLLTGASWAHADLDMFDGSDLADQLDFQSRAAGTLTRLTFDEFDIALDTVSPFVTYGVTPDLDVNLLVPVVRTELDVGARVFVGGENRLPVRDTASVDKSATGVGDVLARAKYRLTPAAQPLGVAVLLGLQAPTGEEKNFHGLGDWVVQPSLVTSWAWDTVDVHALGGFDANAADLTRSRVRYAAGAAVRLTRVLGVTLDVLGSSGVAEDEFEVTANGSIATSNFLRRFQTRPSEPRGATTRVFSAVPRTDVVDLAAGVRLFPVARLDVFASVLIPVVSDGLRAVAIPIVGAAYTF